MTIERRVRVTLDEDAFDPREDWDCSVGRMLLWHNRYSIGDDHSYDSATCITELACEHVDGLEDELNRLEGSVGDALYERAQNEGCEGWDECVAYGERFIRPRIDALVDAAVCDGYVILPVFMYDHSGVALSTGSFNCPWDSGQIGWFVCDKETVDKEFGGNRDKVEKAIRSEVEVYSAYVSGDVWGYCIEEREEREDDDCNGEDDWEMVECCSGFYGCDNETNGIKDALGDDYDLIVN